MDKRKLRQINLIIRNTKINKDFLKFCYNMLRRGIYKLMPDRISMAWPSTFSLELTNKCNLHCVTCPREYDYGKAMIPGEMPTDFAKTIIDQAYPYAQSMGLTGMGETLFAPNLKEVAQYIKSKKKSIVIFISTNANFDGFIDKIKEVLPYINTIQVSTDGIGDVYESVRHGASFELLENNIDKLIPLANEHNVDVMFNMVINKRNYTMMSPLIEFAHQKGVKYVRFTYINLASVTAIPVDYYKFFSSDIFMEEKNKALLTSEKYPEIEVTGLTYPGNPGFFKCPLLWNHFQVNYDGEVPPCCAKPFSREYSLGNVKGKTLKEILNSEAAKSFRSHLKYGTTPDFCKKCHYVNL